MGKTAIEKGIAVCLLVIDLTLKYFAVRGNYAVINQGVSFGLVITSDLVYLLALSVLFVWLYREKMWMVLLGGIANTASRYLWGGVVDYWNFYDLFWNNLADWMIAIGLVVYGVGYFRTAGKLGVPDNRRVG